MGLTFCFKYTFNQSIFFDLNPWSGPRHVAAKLQATIEQDVGALEPSWSTGAGLGADIPNLNLVPMPANASKQCKTDLVISSPKDLKFWNWIFQNRAKSNNVKIFKSKFREPVAW